MKKIIFILTLVLSLTTFTFTQAQEKIEAPEWKLGDKWNYLFRDQRGRSGIEINTIVEVDKILEGTSCYLMQTSNRLLYYNKKIQPLAEADPNGRIYAISSAPLQWIFWPLQIGKEVKQDIKWKNFKTGYRTEYDLQSIIEKTERTSTPAGTFETFKIMTVQGNIWYERWYSPKVKNYVRIVEHLPDNLIEHALVSYQLQTEL